MFSGKDEVLSFIADVIQASNYLSPLRQSLQASTPMLTSDHPFGSDSMKQKKLIQNAVERSSIDA